MGNFFKTLTTPIPFPASGTKKDMIEWVINSQAREIAWWKVFGIGQLFFWITLFTTGKVYMGWFPL